ncbi:MAG: hypothetical protein ACK58L_16850 [Planctomycetota bacterium]
MRSQANHQPTVYNAAEVMEIARDDKIRRRSPLLHREIPHILAFAQTWLPGNTKAGSVLTTGG